MGDLVREVLPPYHVSKLEFGFSHGFTNALQRMQELIPSAIQDYRRIRKRFPSENQLKQLFQTAIENRELIRECPEIFIRYNTNGFFEIFQPK